MTIAIAGDGLKILAILLAILSLGLLRYLWVKRSR